MKYATLPNTPRNNEGFVLVTSLVFLVVITLLAVSAINSSTLQERMASNLREKSRARQAADATLRYGELLLKEPFFDSYRSAGDCYPAGGQGDCTGAGSGLRIFAENQMFPSKPDNPSLVFLDAGTWKAASPPPQTFALDGEMAPGAFFVEDVPDFFQARDLNPDTAAQGDGGTIYRITARAKGQNHAAIAVTQSLYEKRY